LGGGAGCLSYLQAPENHSDIYLISGTRFLSKLSGIQKIPGEKLFIPILIREMASVGMPVLEMLRDAFSPLCCQDICNDYNKSPLASC